MVMLLSMPQSVLAVNKDGWSFDGTGWEGQGSINGTVGNVIPFPYTPTQFLKELYFKHDPNYEGRYTVPTFWDTKTNTIVNNESSEIIRFMNTEFDDLVDEKYRGLTFYPEKLRKEIDELNEWVYPTVKCVASLLVASSNTSSSNGVYRSGFATSQKAYTEAVTELSGSLDRLDKVLEGKTYLVGDQLTEADIRLYTTIIRYDPVYNGHFKCPNTIRHAYPNLHKWVKNLYWNDKAFTETTDFDHIKVRGAVSCLIHSEVLRRSTTSRAIRCVCRASFGYRADFLAPANQPHAHRAHRTYPEH
jgi:putative glutathione S-transferase